MNISAIHHFKTLADASVVGNAVQEVVKPLMTSLIILAGLTCVMFLIVGGVNYITSNGQPDKLTNAKKVIRNALLGLAIVLSAATLTALLTHAYNSSTNTVVPAVPTLGAIKPTSTSLSLVDVIIKAIVGVLQNIIDSVAAPFINALQYFTTATPLMEANPSVFNLWLAVLAMADALFVLVIAALGFNLMSATSLGLNEINVRHVLPQLGLAFLLMNSSIFAIDTVIGLSNGMIDAIHAGFGGISVWQTLTAITQQTGTLSFAALIIMIVFVIMSVILLIYYVGRLITLYLGAILAPLLILLWLLPSFKDFAASAIKTYFTTIFVLFVHVIILELAASIFATLVTTGPNKTTDPLMSLVVGLSTLVALLKTQGVMTQLTYASIGPKAVRQLSSRFINSVSLISNTSLAAREAL